jgi:hypothetical protein
MMGGALNKTVALAQGEAKDLEIGKLCHTLFGTNERKKVG